MKLSLRTFPLTTVKVFFAHESITRGKVVECYIAMLQHGRSTREVSKFLGIFESTCSRIHRECVPHVEPSRGGRACVRAITVGGLDNVVNVRNALNEHLNVVVSTNTMRCALHEARECALQVGICSISSRLDYP